MAVDPTRQRVYARLREVLGEEVATTLMAAPPPFDWAEVATKADLTDLRADLRDEMAVLRSELRGEMAVLRSELRGEMGQLEARLSRDIVVQTRSYMATTVGAVLTTGGLAFAAAGLA